MTIDIHIVAISGSIATGDSGPQSTVHGLDLNVIGPSWLNSTVAICRCERIPVGRVFITKIFVFYFIAIIMNQLEVSFFRSVTIKYNQPFLTPSDSSFGFRGRSTMDQLWRNPPVKDCTNVRFNTAKCALEKPNLPPREREFLQINEIFPGHFGFRF